MNLFDENDFRNIVRGIGERLEMSMRRIATLTKIHSSYFSRVMTGRAVFSASQMFRVASVLRLSGRELDYILGLVEWESATDQGHRKLVQEKLAKIRSEQSRLERLLRNPNAPPLQTEADFTEYYREIATAVVHMYLTIMRFREQPEKIAAATGITPARLHREMQTLERLRLIERQGAKITQVKDFVHLDSRHPMSVQNHVNWRLDAIQKLNARDGNEGDYHFSVVFSANEAARSAVRDAFKAFVVQAEKHVREAKVEDQVYRMAFDLY